MRRIFALKIPAGLYHLPVEMVAGQAVAGLVLGGLAVLPPVVWVLVAAGIVVVLPLVGFVAGVQVVEEHELAEQMLDLSVAALQAHAGAAVSPFVKQEPSWLQMETTLCVLFVPVVVAVVRAAAVLVEFVLVEQVVAEFEPAELAVAVVKFVLAATTVAVAASVLVVDAAVAAFAVFAADVASFDVVAAPSDAAVPAAVVMLAPGEPDAVAAVVDADAVADVEPESAVPAAVAVAGLVDAVFVEELVLVVAAVVEPEPAVLALVFVLAQKGQAKEFFALLEL